MNTLINIILFIFILGILVFVHEFGHFITAKKSGVHIHEFSIGMGPALKTIKGKDGINYSIRALPIGGFVQMAGEIYEDDDTNKIPKDKFMCNRPWWQRLIILAAGVFNNFLLAIIILIVIAFIWGGVSNDAVIYDVIPNKPMSKAGIVAGDEIISVNGKKTKTWDRAQLLLLLKAKDDKYEIGIKHKDGTKDTYTVTPLKEVTKFIDHDNDGVYSIATTIAVDEDFDGKADKDIPAVLIDKENLVYVDRNGTMYYDRDNDWVYLCDEVGLDEAILDEEPKEKEELTTIKVDQDNDGKADLEVEVEYDDDDYIVQKGQPESREFGIQIKAEEMKGNRFVVAFKYGFSKFASVFDQMVLTLGGLFTGKISINQLSGPVGIYTVVGATRESGVESVLMLVAFLSINLGIMNILPIPALDGGHILFLVIELITKKKVNEKVESITTMIFFALLMALMIYITIHDIFTLIIK